MILDLDDAVICCQEMYANQVARMTVFYKHSLKIAANVSYYISSEHVKSEWKTD